MARKVSFEVRTRVGKTVFAYDCIDAARKGKEQAEQRIGIPLKLIQITQIEKELT